MKSDRQPFLEPAILYGGIIGVVTVIHSVIVSILGANFSVYHQIASYLIPIIGLIYCLYAYRKEYLSDQMTYGQAFLMGFAILFISGLINLIYTYVYISYINPDFFNQAEIIMEEKLIRKGMDADLIENVMEKTSRLRTIKWTVIMALIYTIFYGAFVSLIVSAFMKKVNDEPFRDVV